MMTQTLERWAVEADDRPEWASDLPLRCETCWQIVPIGSVAYVERDEADVIDGLFCSPFCAVLPNVMAADAETDSRPLITALAEHGEIGLPR